MEKLPQAFQFYFDLHLLNAKPEDEATALLRGVDIFTKNKLIAHTLRDMKNNALTKRQLVNLSAKKEFVCKACVAHCAEEDGKAPITKKVATLIWQALYREVHRKASLAQVQRKAVRAGRVIKEHKTESKACLREIRKSEQVFTNNF